MVAKVASVSKPCEAPVAFKYVSEINAKNTKQIHVHNEGRSIIVHVKEKSARMQDFLATFQ